MILPLSRGISANWRLRPVSPADPVITGAPWERSMHRGGSSVRPSSPACRATRPGFQLENRRRRKAMKSSVLSTNGGVLVAALLALAALFPAPCLASPPQRQITSNAAEGQPFTTSSPDSTATSPP